MKKTVFRVGDKIRIVNPEFVKRVGYPMDFGEVMSEFYCKNKELIEKVSEDLLLKIYHHFPYEGDFGKFIEAIVKVCASEIMRKECYGGAKRDIYTIDIPGLRNNVLTVTSRKIVSTGYRSGVTGSQDDPPSFQCTGRHVLLEVAGKLGAEGWIEAKNVEKV